MDFYVAGTLILGAFVWGLCAYYCYQVAPRFHRRARNWAILGIVFGPIALMVLYVLPKGNVVSDKGRGAQPGRPGTKKAQQQAALYEKPKKK
jgi:hypothetical protein